MVVALDQTNTRDRKAAHIFFGNTLHQSSPSKIHGGIVSETFIAAVVLHSDGNIKEVFAENK